MATYNSDQLDEIENIWHTNEALDIIKESSPKLHDALEKAYVDDKLIWLDFTLLARAANCSSIDGIIATFKIFNIDELNTWLGGLVKHETKHYVFDNDAHFAYYKFKTTKEKTMKISTTIKATTKTQEEKFGKISIGGTNMDMEKTMIISNKAHIATMTRDRVKPLPHIVYKSILNVHTSNLLGINKTIWDMEDTSLLMVMVHNTWPHELTSQKVSALRDIELKYGIDLRKNIIGRLCTHPEIDSLPTYIWKFAPEMIVVKIVEWLEVNR